jgi:Asp-tRNA(Asn)/Glu-tRNA(Gln) amidotransferase C subunit
MDTSAFNLLCEASQLSFSDDEKIVFSERLNSMAEFAGSVKNINCDLNAANDAGTVSLCDLREDTAQASLPPEKLLANTEPLFDCYVIPKIME